MGRTRREKLSLLIGLALLAAGCAYCKLAWSHSTRLSSIELRVTGARIDGVLIVNRTDMEAALGILSTPGSLPERVEEMHRYIASRARIVNSAGTACSPEMQPTDLDGEHLKIPIRWTCPPIGGMWTYHNSLFHEIDPATRQMVTVVSEPRRMALLSTSSAEVTLGESQAGIAATFGHYIVAGIEHIAIGYDHIAFLVAVMAWGRRLWPLVKVVTAFTVAHSVTLSLAVLGVISPPERLVEILIALSIAYVAAENFFVHDLRRRWILTFLFGLVHGFGFAGVLRDYGLPPQALGWALAGFNVGVEIGQIAVVLAAVCALRVCERALNRGDVLPDTRLVYPVSGLVFLLGMYWSVERAFFA